MGGGPMRKSTVHARQQQDSVEGDVSKDSAVALSWTEDDTTEFLVHMLSSMDVKEKEQVINMLVHEYGADAFSTLFERAVAAQSQMRESGSAGTKSSTYS